MSFDRPASNGPEHAGVKGPLRVVVVCPSWVGDVVMATPALGMIRRALPGAFVGALVRPGIDQLLAGSELFDELHVDRASGIMGPKRVASKLRARAYDAALLLTNSFSSALVTRLAFIPRRVGYDRDARGLLLTERLAVPRRAGGGFACASAVDYYLRAARALLGPDRAARFDADAPPIRMHLGITPEQRRSAAEVLARAGVEPGADPGGYAVLNPGANNPDKRWPAERFAELAAFLVRERSMRVLVNGSPAEADLVDQVVAAALDRLGEPGGAGRSEHVTTAPVAGLVRAGITLGALKGVLQGARLLVSNDTGPRHIAAAFDVPCVTLYGPTDPRWTTLPTWPGSGPRAEIAADPDLPSDLVADDHPERCRIDRIDVPRVIKAIDGVLDHAR